MRDSIGTGIYFMTYESSKQLLTTFGGDHTHSNPLAVLVAGGLCGIVSWAMICESAHPPRASFRADWDAGQILSTRPRASTNGTP